MGIGSFFENLVGDVTKGVEEVIPGARNIDRFLNKAGIGPADFADNPFKPKGWAGDIEHAYSQVTHIPAIRDSQFAAAAILAAMYAPEALPYIESYLGTSGAAVSEADMASMMAEGSADVAAGGSAATAADAASIAAEAGVPGATAADAATLAGTPLASAPMLDPSQLIASTDAATAAAYGPGMIPSAASPGLYGPALAQDPAAFSQFVSSPVEGGFPVSEGFNPADFSAADAAMADTSLPSITPGQTWGQYLMSPKGALTALGTGASLYSLLNRAQLPGYAKQAGAAAGPASAQAQTMLASGGQGSPLWGQQKSAIDAQIDQQIQNFSRAVQQNAQNSGQGGANSMVVQSQIAEVTKQLEAQRQSMYMAAQQQNVNNAVAELTGANQTLMALANLQFQEDQQAQQLARNVGLVTGNLASLWPSS